MKKQNSRKICLIIGLGLMLIGAVLFFLNSPRQILVIEDGVSRKIRTWHITVRAILAQEGIVTDEDDHIFPPLDYWLAEGTALRADHVRKITLTENGVERQFLSSEKLIGNMLLDGKRQLFPGDEIRWKGIPQSADQAPILSGDISLEIMEMIPIRVYAAEKEWEAYLPASTRDVSAALAFLGKQLADGQQVTPALTDLIEPGMTIAVFTPIQLTIQIDGGTLSAETYGRTVGEALLNAGIKLSGFDQAIPPESAPIPADRKVAVQRTRWSASLEGTPVAFQTSWRADPERMLDDILLESPGINGFSGKVTIDKSLDGEEMQKITTEEKQLFSPVDARGVYGSRVEVRTLDTPQGQISYYRAVPVYATSYSPCRSGVEGCINGTASGRKVEHGVIAVTGTWYGLLAGSSVYIPDYGVAVIGDTGRSANGSNRWVDLAYNDEEFVPWSQNTMLYFLAPPPSDFPMVLP